jgi:hypothetical protein
MTAIGLLGEVSQAIPAPLRSRVDCAEDRSKLFFAKGKSGESPRRKATGPRYLYDVTVEIPKIAGLPFMADSNPPE